MEQIPILWLSGPPGVGKTTVAWEIYRRLQRDAAPAYVDVDQLGICYPPRREDPDRHTLKARNVAALRANFAAAGARVLIVSGVVDARHGPDPATLGGGPVTVVRLRADSDALRARLRARDGVRAQSDAAVAEAQVLDRSTYADRCVDTSGLSADEAAARILRDMGEWPTPGKVHPYPAPSDHGADGEMLWLTGPAGVGKSTVGFRAWLDVTGSGTCAAYVDIGQIGFCSTAPDDHALRARNLAALWRNFHAAGARHAIVVGRVSTASEARLYEAALPHTKLTWCRLHVGDAERTRRILSRGEGGSWSEPGDPLRGCSRDELLGIARQAVAGRDGIGLAIDVDGLDIAGSAARVLARWAARAIR